MPPDGPPVQRIRALEDWRDGTVDPWMEAHSPILDKLRADQTYRARYASERSNFWQRTRRTAAVATACASAITLIASSVVELVRLF